MPKQRRKINISEPMGDKRSKEEILLESDKFDPENYDPLKDIENKEILLPDNRTELITTRLTKAEKELFDKYIKDNNIGSKSLFIRETLLNIIDPNAQTIENNDFSELAKRLSELLLRLDELEKTNKKLSNNNKILLNHLNHSKSGRRRTKPPLPKMKSS